MVEENLIEKDNENNKANFNIHNNNETVDTESGAKNETIVHESTAQIESNDTESGAKNEYLNKLTLELFMNKNTYQKYISQTNPELNNKLREHYDSITKYKTRILKLTNELLDDTSLQITTDVNETFNDYVKCLVSHFKMKEFDNNDSYETDTDTLFGTIEDNDIQENNSSKTEHDIEEDIPSSFSVAQHNLWGGKRVVRKNV
jgi:hypothetical protein